MRTALARSVYSFERLCGSIKAAASTFASSPPANSQLPVTSTGVRSPRGSGRLRPLFPGHASHRTRWSAPCLFLLLLIALPICILLLRALRALGPETSISSCQERLKAAGLDFGDEGADGAVRVAVSRYALERRRLYERMGVDGTDKGLQLGGIITQGLRQADLFAARTDLRARRVHLDPILHSLDIPVRAMVLPIVDRVVSGKLAAALEKHVVRLLPEASIWLQDDHMYHATLFHASSHAQPLPATPAEVEAEAASIRAVASNACPVRTVLERIVMTASGVIIACWQALPQGGEPAVLRQSLAAALPRAPSTAGQMVKEPSILHTTIARLLLPPGVQQQEGSHSKGSSAQDGSSTTAAATTAQAMQLLPPAGVLVQAVANMSAALCGLTHTFSEMWFVEEQDLLALALHGRFVKHLAPLSCPADAEGGAHDGQEGGSGVGLLRSLFAKPIRYTGNTGNSS